MDEERRAAARKAAVLGGVIGIAIGIPLWIAFGDPFGYIGAGVAALAVGFAIKSRSPPGSRPRA